MTFNGGQDVMKGQSGHLSIRQAHNIAQHQPSRILSLLTTDGEGLQLMQAKIYLIYNFPSSREAHATSLNNLMCDRDAAEHLICRLWP